MASKSLTAAFDPKMISTFRRGIRMRDVGKVKAALDAGVSPDTSLSDSDHVLFELLYNTYDEDCKAAEAGMDEETFDANTSEIVDMLLSRGMTLTEGGRYETSFYGCLLDHFMMSDSLADTSNVVLHGLYESLHRGEGPYRPSIKLQMESFMVRHGVDVERTDMQGCFTHVMALLENVHNIVRARLLHPETEIEKKLVEEFDTQLGYWKGPFPRPSMATLLSDMGIPMLSAKRKVSAPKDAQKPQGGQQKTGAGASQQKAAADDAFMQQMAPLVQKLERRDPQAVMQDIEADFIGLDAIKGSARKIILRQQFDCARQVQGKKAAPQSHSTVFLGNPGLGKTTFARKKAELLYALGLSGGNYVEVSRENVVGGFIGHTEAKMTALFQLADVVFIDEAYNLAESGSSNDFGKRVIDSLLTALENKPELTVFMAGYPAEMERLLSSNPGLRSRVTRFETFEDMTQDQLGQTLDLMLEREDMRIDADARAYVLQQLDDCRKKLGEKHFGNARLVRNIARGLPDVMAERLFGGDTKKLVTAGGEDLSRVTLQDVKALDYAAILGTGSKAAVAVNDLPRNHPEWRPSIGFLAKI